MSRKITEKGQKQAKKNQEPRGRPAYTNPGQIKTQSLRFRVTASEADLIDLAAVLAGRTNRSTYARERLLYFARTIARSRDVDITTPNAVKQALLSARKAAEARKARKAASQ